MPAQPVDATPFNQLILQYFLYPEVPTAGWNGDAMRQFPSSLEALPWCCWPQRGPPLLSIVLWSFVAMGIYSFFGPFFSIPSNFLAGFSAASGIALINSVGSLGGFVGPSVTGALANGPRGIYGGLALAGVSLFLSATLVLLLPKTRGAGRLPATLVHVLAVTDTP